MFVRPRRDNEGFLNSHGESLWYGVAKCECALEGGRSSAAEVASVRGDGSPVSGLCLPM